ncbi:hypothetical protein DBR11_20425 [Pedobacter sp. HMWF019]|nr:hypothetical protein DBR11_20425 [Pedobacter sp. HMWF019]
MYFNFTRAKTLKKLLLIPIVLLIFSHPTRAQFLNKIKTEIETQATGTTGNTVPFWMRSNQYGSVPLSGASASFIARARKDYETQLFTDSNSRNKRLTDWGFGFEGRANGGKNSNLLLIEAYAKFRIGVFQIKAGRSKDVMGLNGDTTLSSGNFAVSGNALGIPKVEIAIPEYYSLPFFSGLFSVKGTFSHGWLGKLTVLDKIGSAVKINNTHPSSYLHQKSLYIRLGKPDWKLKFYGGFNHQVYWGDERSVYGPNYKLSPIETFFYVVTGKTYSSKGILQSKIGNQIGSLDVAAEYDFNAIKVMIYRQNFYDVGALSKLANIADGLNGISIENKRYNSRNSGFQWKKALFEFFYSKDQAGYPWSTPTKSGDEDYYNNSFYIKGWSYNGMGVGNPLITRRDDARDGQATNKQDYFINNRVVALHLGLQGTLNDLIFLTKLTYSWNYGTFGTSPYGHSMGNMRETNTTNLFVPVQQFSFYAEGLKELKKGYSAGLAAAFDQGKLLDNSTGLTLKLIKKF